MSGVCFLLPLHFGNVRMLGSYLVGVVYTYLLKYLVLSKSHLIPL